LFFISLAQEKQIKKSKKLFDKEKYQKCIVKTSKFLKKHQRNPELQYYITSSVLELTHQQKSEGNYFQVKRILDHYLLLESYNQGENDYSSLSEEVRNLMLPLLEDEKLKEIQKDYFHVKLAERFGDTTNYYRMTYLTIQEEVFVNNEVLPIIDTLYQLDSLRKILIQSALTQVGAPYKYGGIDSTGFDCSGFTQYLYKEIGIELPHNAQLQSELGKLIPLEEAETGDLIFFGQKRASHAAMIYVNRHGTPELIHCVSRGVSHDTETDNNHIYWMKRNYRVKRYLGF
jgi:hypothetical protein